MRLAKVPRPMSALQQNVIVVCHQLRSVENLGSIARVMANFGFGRLTLSDPVTYAFSAAHKLAIGAEKVIDDMAVARDLQEALGPAVWVLGTTSRENLKRRVAIDPQEAARRLSDQSVRGPVALLLGGEKRGLSDEELSRCDEIAVIPTSSVQPSMNISHAAAVLLYLVANTGSPKESAASEPAAPKALLQKLEEELQGALTAAGWLNPQAPEHALRELTRSLSRSALSQREAQMWLSAFLHLSRSLRR